MPPNRVGKCRFSTTRTDSNCPKTALENSLDHYTVACRQIEWESVASQQPALIQTVRKLPWKTRWTTTPWKTRWTTTAGTPRFDSRSRCDCNFHFGAARPELNTVKPNYFPRAAGVSFQPSSAARFGQYWIIGLANSICRGSGRGA